MKSRMWSCTSPSRCAFLSTGPIRRCSMSITRRLTMLLVLEHALNCLSFPIMIEVDWYGEQPSYSDRVYWFTFPCWSDARRHWEGDNSRLFLPSPDFIPCIELCTMLVTSHGLQQRAGRPLYLPLRTPILPQPPHPPLHISMQASTTMSRCCWPKCFPQVKVTARDHFLALEATQSMLFRGTSRFGRHDRRYRSGIRLFARRRRQRGSFRILLHPASRGWFIRIHLSRFRRRHQRDSRVDGQMGLRPLGSSLLNLQLPLFAFPSPRIFMGPSWIILFSLASASAFPGPGHVCFRPPAEAPATFTNTEIDLSFIARLKPTPKVIPSWWADCDHFSIS